MNEKKYSGGEEICILRDSSVFLHFSWDCRVLFESAPASFLVLDRTLKIIEVTDLYLKATMTRRENILGRYLFEVFPYNPDDPKAVFPRQLHASLNRVLKYRRPYEMEVIRQYDASRERKGTRYWSCVNSPVPGPDGEIEYIIHRLEDVTRYINLKPKGVEPAQPAGEKKAFDEGKFKKIVELAGAIYSGIQELPNGSPNLVLFTDPVTHGTSALPIAQVTVRGVTEALNKSRAKFKHSLVVAHARERWRPFSKLCQSFLTA